MKESYFTSEEGAHHTNGKTCHTEGFGQGVLGAQMGQQLYGKDLWQKKTKLPLASSPEVNPKGSPCVSNLNDVIHTLNASTCSCTALI